MYTSLVVSKSTYRVDPIGSTGLMIGVSVVLADVVTGGRLMRRMGCGCGEGETAEADVNAVA